MLVTTKHGSVVVPANFPRRESKDNRMHACMRPAPSGGMRLICIFMPAGDLIAAAARRSAAGLQDCDAPAHGRAALGAVTLVTAYAAHARRRDRRRRVDIPLS